MPCDKTVPQATINRALDRLRKALAGRQVTVVIGPNGAIALKG